MTDNPLPSSPKPEDVQCPVCGYYCLGRGGVGCIDKPSMQQPSSPTSKGREEFYADVYGMLAHMVARGFESSAIRLKTAIESARVRELAELRASLTEAQAEIERLKVDRDSWRRCADAREAERLELRRAFLDFVIYVRGESPSLLADESIDAYRVADLEARLKAEDRCRVCGGSGFVATKQCIGDGYGEVDSCPECCSRGAQ